jgi:hypothetical protein
MVEIEIGVLRKQCLDRRIAQRSELESEIAISLRRRNASGEKINWLFNCEKARLKMRQAYPKLLSESDPDRIAA